jgi:hypothetical protein
VHYSPSLSQETNAFTADVWINGKPGFHVRNDGGGGCDFQSHEQMNAQLAAVNFYAKSLPSRKYGPADHQVILKEDAESLVGELLEDWILRRAVKRNLSKKMQVTMKNKPGIFSFRAPFHPSMVAGMRAIHPQIDKILNELPFEEAFAIYKADSVKA